MVENARQMMCGGCGCEMFRVYTVDDNLVTECISCGSHSIISPTQPKLNIAWGEKATGVLAMKG